MLVDRQSTLEGPLSVIARDRLGSSAVSAHNKLCGGNQPDADFRASPCDLADGARLYRPRGISAMAMPESPYSCRFHPGIFLPHGAQPVACQLRGIGCSMLTREPSVSMKATYLPTPGISIGSPRTLPPAAVTAAIAAGMSSTAMTSEGCCAGHSGLRPSLSAGEAAPS